METITIFPISIQTHEEYFSVMDKIENFLKKATQGGGFGSLVEADNEELQRLSLLASDYEKRIKLMPLRQPLTLAEMINVKMVQFRLSQKALAKLLEVPESGLSEVLNGKRKVNMELAKKLHEKLKIDAGFILERA